MEIKPKDSSGHIDVLDTLRGFAALAVVMVHYGGLGFLNDSILAKIFYYGTYGVHVFFVISGFIIPWSLYNAGYKAADFFKFITKRFLRISLPYYAAVTLVATQHYFTGYDGEGAAFEPLRLLFHFLYIIPFTGFEFYDPVFWTLTVEFQYYVLIGLLFRVIEALPGIFLYGLYFLSLFSFYIPLPGKEYTVFHYASLFVMGVLVFLFYSRRIKGVHFLVLGSVTAGVCFFQLGIEAAIAGLLSFGVIAFVRWKN